MMIDGNGNNDVMMYHDHLTMMLLVIKHLKPALALLVVSSHEVVYVMDIPVGKDCGLFCI